MGSSTVEADDWIRKAEKCLKTSLFKRSPDYDGAIEAYNNAALIYRKAKNLVLAAELYKKVAELQLKANSFFQAAKNYETSSILYKELQQFETAANLFSEAGEYLQRCGAIDSATFLYARAAKSLEQSLPLHAAKFYESAADTCSMEEKFNEAIDYCSNGARIYVRVDQFDDANRLLRQYITFCLRSSNTSASGGSDDLSTTYCLIARAVFVMILIKLSISDEVAAGKVYTEAINQWYFNQTDEGILANELITAFEQRDLDAAKRLLQKPCVKHLDLAYTKLTKEVLRIVEKEAVPTAPTEMNHGDAASRQPEAEDDEDIC